MFQGIKKLVFFFFLIFFISFAPSVDAACSSQKNFNVTDFNSMNFLPGQATTDQIDCMNELGYEVKVGDKGTLVAVKGNTMQDRMLQLKTWALDELWNKTIKEGAAAAFWKASSNALNKIAYDTATWIGEGGKGTKPLFVTEDWGVYLANIADNAAGEFLEDLGTNGAVKFNLCEPSFAFKMQVGLGLKKQVRPGDVDCTFRKMVAKWDEALDDPKFLENFQDMFKPESNDLGYALSLQTMFFEKQMGDLDKAKTELTAKKGWLDIRSISGKLKAMPTQEALTSKTTTESVSRALSINNFTGTFLDAANLFLNQLAITLYYRLIDNMNDKDQSITSPYAGDYGGFGNYSADPNSGKISIKDQMRKILEPNFSVRGDYDILAELAACPNPQKAGPTNCVIDEKFRQAIIDRITVGEAVAQGYLNPNAAFGYLASGLEPNYLEGYPYRSLAILRKFRIIPVGWELAAQKLKIDGRSVTMKQALDCYNGSSNGACDGLVGLIDPNWVLKAPLNYCKKEGPGPEIMSSQIMGEGYESKVALLRNDNYCADEQSCIKENDDGSCQYYGYCTEEKRTWQFNADSCEPVYNTCQTFRSADGRTVSYLENTLEFCSADGAGCTEYSRSYNYSNNTWSATPNIYLNSRTEACEVTDEGCRQLIRTKSGLGVNLIKDSSFEKNDNAYWSGLEFNENDSYDGITSASSTGNFTKYIDVAKNTLGTQYAFSFYAKNCNGAAYSLSVDNANGSCIDGICGETISGNTGWQRFEIKHNFKINNNNNRLRIAIDFSNTSGCLIDALQLEEGPAVTDYKEYGQAGVIYEKLMPSALDSYCDISPNATSTVCKSAYTKFAQYCSAGEVGCELYTSQTDGTAIPAQVTAPDYCESTCVGYDTYIQRETVFENSQPAYFIPNTARTCSADSAGCDEFTNLDKVKSGGEAREYYTNLKQCILPSAALCADFYTWEGSNESGYQLKTYSLERGGNGPATTTDSFEGKVCNASTYDPVNNPLCREYLDKAGNKYYAFDIATITCSDACRAYRRTEVNIDGSISSTNCDNASGDRGWNGSSCVVCKAGGTWDSQQQACIYMAIPGEGKKCSAAQVGCRAYSGNKGANYQIIKQWNFDGVDKEGWAGTGVEKTTESIVAGGGSLSVRNGGSGDASVSVSGLISDDTSYNLSFLAKQFDDDSGSGTITSICFNNGVHDACFNQFSGGATSSSIVFGSGWKLYTVNIDLRDYRYIHNISDTESLVITANNSFYIDNIKLTQVIDRYYLIKNSWNTPTECDRDIEGNPYPLYDLGCDYYKDRDERDHYLHNFTSLCLENAVGCELLIDTRNSSNYQSETTNSVTVPEDDYIYAVYDRNKECAVEDKGCEMLGKKYAYATSTLYSKVYLRNNPDRYADILCNSDQVGCKAWSKGGTTSVFKDPGDMVCEWREGTWLKKKVKRCTAGGNICLSNSDCSSGSCQEESTAQPCEMTSEKTIGYGGAANAVYQPKEDGDNNWVGLCPASQSGCTEIIDPVSEYSANLLFNPKCNSIDGDASDCDGWSIAGNIASQPVNLDQNTLYVLNGSGVNTTITSGSLSNFKLLNYGNTFNNEVSSIATSGRVLFKTGNSLVSYNLSRTNSASSDEVSLRRAIVEYRIKDDLDRKTCTQENIEKGCVRFNERSMSGASGYVGLDAEYKTPGIIKVSPNRVCDKWLSCRSYVKDEKGNNVCFDIGLCQGIDDNGNCSSPVISTGNAVTQTYNNNPTAYANASGYNKVGWANLAYDKIPHDLYNLGSMKQDGNLASISNGSFEFYGTNRYPVGWNFEDGSGYSLQTANSGGATTTTAVWNSNIFYVISSPYEMQNEGICFKRNPQNNCELFAPDGQAVLRLGSAYNATTEYFEVAQASTYIVSAYINTKNLSTGSALLQVISDTDSVLASSSVPAGRDWTKVVISFNSNSSTLVKIRLRTADGSTGAIHADNINIRPSLEVKSGSWYASQSCRLYPEDSSLSCDYYTDSGIRQKGWYGYCLEYDKAPGDPNACILWYPLDRVKGDEIFEPGAGYSGKYPVYYTISSSSTPASLFVNFGATGFSMQESTNAAYCNVLIHNLWGDRFWKVQYDRNPELFLKDRIDSVEVTSYFQQQGSNNYNTVTLSRANNWGGVWVSMPGGGSDRWHARLAFDEGLDGNDYLKYLYTAAHDQHQGGGGNGNWYLSSVKINLNLHYASSIVQVVSPTGANKAWLSKVYSGSEATTTCYSGLSQEVCSYNSNSSPFGSMTPPVPFNNPYEWDGDVTMRDTQPVYFGGLNYSSINSGINNADPKMGFRYNVNDLKRIFAKSYGSWTWTSSSCDGGYADGKYCSDNADCEKACVASTQQYCQKGNIILNDLCEATSTTACVSTSGYCDGVNGNLGNCVGGFYNGSSCKNENTIPNDDFCQEVKCSKFCINMNGLSTDTFCQADEDCNATPLPYCGSSGRCVNGANNGGICTDNSQCRNICGTNATPGPQYGYGKCQGGTNPKTLCDINNPSQCVKDTGVTCINGKCSGGINIGKDCYYTTDSVYISSGKQSYGCSDATGAICVTKNVCEGENISCTNNPNSCNGTCSGRTDPKYIGNQDIKWDPPACVCGSSGCAANYCAIPPVVGNITVNGSSTSATITKNGFANLTFTSDVNDDQQPLVMYKVDWGDGESTVVSGAEMRDRPSTENPHSLYHLYDYWDLKARDVRDKANKFSIDCTTTSGQCTVQPKVQIKDNWGWCSGDSPSTGNTACNLYRNFSGNIVVREK